jgi:carbon storage regulator CsrA
MLVLSRKADQEFCFPQLGISVRVVQVQGQRVRLGVEAPPEIQVLRSEILEPSLPATHDLTNRLNAANLGLHVAERLIGMGRIEEAAGRLEESLKILQQLDREAHSATAGSADADTAPRILLVEDDDNERSLLTALLELEGFVVTTAVDGLDALQQLQVCTPDFVLMDMRMPRCNGRETVEKIRAHAKWRTVPVIAVSGTAPEAEGLSIGPDGVNAWIPKPVQPQKLVQRLRNRIPTDVVA